MSYFVMRPESIWQLANTLESIMNAATFSNTCTLTTAATCSTPMCNAFTDCASLSGTDYDAEPIAAALWEINNAAYAGRYRVPETPPLPEYVAGTGRSLCALPVFIDHAERPQPWHYHLCRLLDCWLYQTNEDATRNNKKRIALEAFTRNLKCLLVSHAPEYTAGRWGE